MVVISTRNRWNPNQPKTLTLDPKHNTNMGDISNATRTIYSVDERQGEKYKEEWEKESVLKGRTVGDRSVAGPASVVFWCCWQFKGKQMVKCKGSPVFWVTCVLKGRDGESVNCLWGNSCTFNSDDWQLLIKALWLTGNSWRRHPVFCKPL